MRNSPVIEIPFNSAYLSRKLELQRKQFSHLLGEVAEAFDANDYTRAGDTAEAFEATRTRMATTKSHIDFVGRHERFMTRTAATSRLAGTALVASIAFGPDANYKQITRINPGERR